jgi:hypothetical protein
VPNIWTHILFCEEVIDAVNQPFLTSPNESYLKLGAQGPDPFFYYNFWPWIKKNPVQQIGNAIHTKQCGPFLMDLIISAKTKSKHVKAYVTGFITHHILDRNTHPFIHYHAGYEINNHQRYEIIIDTLLMETNHRIKTWKTQVYKEIDVGKNLDEETLDLLHSLIKKHFSHIPFHSFEYMNKAYKDMILALKILSDPYGWKNFLLHSYISPFSHQPIRGKKDYLNLEHQTWYHSATNEPSTKSFMDLYEESKIEAIAILNELVNYWDKDKEVCKVNLEKLIGNISYDTGKPLSLQLENKYCQPII